jgi:glycosyltransferase involved in cell wall biosynthesis
MVLHARGLEELGVRTTLAFGDDAVSFGVPAIDARTGGARLLAGTLAALRRDPPDVINVHSASAPAFVAARRAGLLTGKVVAMSYAADERALSVIPGASPAVLRRLRAHVPYRASMRFASGVWCVSRQDADYYIERYRVRPDRVRYLPHAIEATFFERLDVPRLPTQLAFVGTWNRRKGDDVILGAMAEVARARPDVTLVIAGTLGTEADVRDRFSAEARGRVRVVPRLDDAALRRLYHESALLLVPSRLEGMPFTMLEAMACGSPALAADNSGMRDAIADGENGWLLSTFEPSAWAAKMLELVGSPPRLRAASDAARVHAERFRLRPLSEAALSWYDSLPP